MNISTLRAGPGIPDHEGVSAAAVVLRDLLDSAGRGVPGVVAGNQNRMHLVARVSAIPELAHLVTAPALGVAVVEDGTAGVGSQ